MDFGKWRKKKKRVAKRPKNTQRRGEKRGKKKKKKRNPPTKHLNSTVYVAAYRTKSHFYSSTDLPYPSSPMSGHLFFPKASMYLIVEVGHNILTSHLISCSSSPLFVSSTLPFSTLTFQARLYLLNRSYLRVLFVRGSFPSFFLSFFLSFLPSFLFFLFGSFNATP